MLKKTLNLKGVKTLSTSEQKGIKGGYFGGGCNQQILAQCFSDEDCPCNRSCGVTVNTADGPIFFADVCQFS